MGNGLEQVEAGEYEYPYQIHKVPVKADLFYHLIVAAALIGTIHGIYQHQDVEHHTAQYVATVEACDRKEEVIELVRRFCDLELVCVLVSFAGSIKEAFVLDRLNISASESTPEATDLVMKVRPFPGLAGKERDTADDRPQQPLDHAFTVVVVAGMYRKHHRHRAKDEDEGH